MEREETEEKESVRKTEKERPEMKYKAGDKVRVRSDLKERMGYGCQRFTDAMKKQMGKIVTISNVVDDRYYYIKEDNYNWTDEMLEPVEEELTAEEAIRLRGEMCEGRSCSRCKLSAYNNGTGITCNELAVKHPERYIEVLKQYKKDHEKKEIEVVKKTCCLVIDEKRTVVHEEEIDNHDSCEEVLKRYCEEHDGKFFAICESRYAVKE
jgi:hypothetical protein